MAADAHLPDKERAGHRRSLPLHLQEHCQHYGLAHGTYIRWYLINRCARKEQSLLFDLYKAFD